MESTSTIFKLFILAVVCFTIIHGTAKDDIQEKIEEALKKEGRTKKVVKVVSEQSHKPETATQPTTDVNKDKTSEKIKADKKTVAGNKADDKKKTGGQLKKTASGSPDDIKSAAARAAKSGKKTGEKASVKSKKHDGKSKHDATEASKNVESSTEAEQPSGGFADRVLHILSDVKNSILEPVGLGSKHHDNVSTPATTKAEPVADETKKASGKGKKKAEDTGDL